MPVFGATIGSIPKRDIMNDILLFLKIYRNEIYEI